MIRAIIWIILSGTIFYTSILYKSPSLALLGFFSAALFAAAYLFLICRIRHIHGSLRIPISIAERKTPLTVQLHIENDSLLTCTKFCCCLERSSSFLNKKQKKWLRGVLALPGENSYSYPAVFENYGSYTVALKKVRIYDLTGFFYLQKPVNSSGFVQVFPKIQEIGVHLTEAARNFFGDSDVFDDFRPGHDRSELFQIRPFQNGDKIQSIHWKLSVKTDDLLVKENSLPKACPVVFLLDYAGGRQKQAERVNAYFSVLAGISFSLMDAGCPHFAVWYSTAARDVVRFRVDDEESLYAFLSIYLEERSQEKAENLQAAYEEKYRGEHYLCVLRLNEEPELFQGQEKIAVFTGKDWEKKLQELELVIAGK